MLSNQGEWWVKADLCGRAREGIKRNILPNNSDKETKNSWGNLSKRVSFLRNCAAILKANRPLEDWNEVLEEMHDVLELKGRFTVKAFSEDKALAEFACREDRDELVRAEELYLSNCTISGSIWHEKFGVAKDELKKTKDRWVYLIGMPFHQWSSVVFETFVQGLKNLIGLRV